MSIQRRRWVAALGTAALAVAGVGALATSPAYAASGVSVANNELRINAAAGKANKITVQLTGAVYTVTDNGDTVAVGAGCTGVTVRQVRCTASGIGTVRANLGDGDDILDARTTNRAIVIAGAGHDLVLGSKGADIVSGGPGNDNLTGYDGADRLSGDDGIDALNGGNGRDILDGGIGADTFVGGPDIDQVTYASRSFRVSANLDGAANDGEVGEGDKIGTDVEDLVGGRGPDRLNGNVFANNLSGGGGGDTISGSGGADRLTGGTGDDSMNGGVGNDDLDGSQGSDFLAGGPDRDEVIYSSAIAGVRVDLDNVADDGQTDERDNVRTDVEDLTGSNFSDMLFGSSAANRLIGRGGIDALFGRGEADTLYGDDGDDYLYADEGDDSLNGGAGKDYMYGDDGRDSFYGGAGSDHMFGDCGTAACSEDLQPDYFSGGANGDYVDYIDHKVGVRASLDDNAANDGAPGEKDLIRDDVEWILGTQLGDTLIGSGQSNGLEGRGGNDVLYGLGGDDWLDCGAGPDDLAHGGSGLDGFYLCERKVDVDG